MRWHPDLIAALILAVALVVLVVLPSVVDWWHGRHDTFRRALDALKATYDEHEPESP